VAGPALLLKIGGTLDPHAFDNTPLSGTHVDVMGAVGIGVLIALAWLRRRRRDPADIAPEQVDENASRSVDVVARARRSASV
jgi:uncharacterized protein (TIGR03382 family)